MARLSWSRAAQNDVRQIRAYIAQDAPTAADRMVRRLRSEAERLAQHPEMGRMVPEYADASIREVIVAPYRLMYRYQRERNHIQVLGVIHGSRALPPLSDA